MATTTFAGLRNARLACKVMHTTYEEVRACLEPHQIEMAEVLASKPETKGAFECLPMEKEATNFVDDLAQIAKIGSFDVDDIDSIAPLVLPSGKILCKGGNLGQTSIDDVRLKDGDRYFIKHGGSGSNPQQDVEVYSEIQLIAAVLDEDIPHMVWSNPGKGRFAMTEMVSRASSGVDWVELQPHELMTSITFELLINDVDRNQSNLVILDDGVAGHLDFAAGFIGRNPERQTELHSRIARNLTLARRDANNAPVARDFMDNLRPGFSEAVREAYIKWRRDWLPTLKTLGPDLKTKRLPIKFQLGTPPSPPTDRTDPELISQLALDKTEDYLATMVAEMGFGVSQLRDEAKKLTFGGPIPPSGAGPLREKITVKIAPGMIEVPLKPGEVPEAESQIPERARGKQGHVGFLSDPMSPNFECNNYANDVALSEQDIDDIELPLSSDPIARSRQVRHINNTREAILNTFRKFNNMDVGRCLATPDKEFQNNLDILWARRRVLADADVPNVCEATADAINLYMNFVVDIGIGGNRDCSFLAGLDKRFLSILREWRRHNLFSAACSEEQVRTVDALFRDVIRHREERHAECGMQGFMVGGPGIPVRPPKPDMSGKPPKRRRRSDGMGWAATPKPKIGSVAEDSEDSEDYTEKAFRPPKPLPVGAKIGSVADYWGIPSETPLDSDVEEPSSFGPPTCDLYLKALDEDAEILASAEEQALVQMAVTLPIMAEARRRVDKTFNEFRQTDVSQCPALVRREFENNGDIAYLEAKERQLQAGTDPAFAVGVCDVFKRQLILYQEFVKDIGWSDWVRERDCSFMDQLDQELSLLQSEWKNEDKSVWCSTEERKELEGMFKRSEEVQSDARFRCKAKVRPTPTPTPEEVIPGLPRLKSGPFKPPEPTPPPTGTGLSEFRPSLGDFEPTSDSTSAESLDLLDQALREMVQVVTLPDKEDPIKPPTGKSRPKSCVKHKNNIEKGFKLVATAMLKEDCSAKTRKKIEAMDDKIFEDGVRFDLAGCPEVMKGELDLHEAVTNRWTECLQKKPATKYQRMIASIDTLGGFVNFIDPTKRLCNTLPWAVKEENSLTARYEVFRKEGFPSEGTFDVDTLISNTLKDLDASFITAETQCEGA